MKQKWQTVRLGNVLREVNRPERVVANRTYRLLGVRWYGKGLFVKDAMLGSEIKATTVYRVEPGDFVYNRLFAWKGSFGLAESETKDTHVSNEFPCFQVTSEKLHPGFLKWFCCQESFWEQVNKLSTGSSRQSRLRLKEARFLNLEIPLPDLPEQERLAARLDALSARLAEARRLHDVLEEEQQEFVAALARPDLSQRAKQVAGWRKSRLGEVLTERVVPVAVEKKKQYPTIGVYSFARGIIRKPPILGSETKATRLYRVRAGQFIYGRLGGYEGAFGFVPPWADGACVSGEFPAFDCKPDAVLAEYLFAYFNSPQVWKAMSDACRGLAGRRIRLKESAFLAHEVWLPPLRYQQTVRDTLRQIQTARALHADLPAELDALQSALLDRAFNGEL